MPLISILELHLYYESTHILFVIFSVFVWYEIKLIHYLFSPQAQISIKNPYITPYSKNLYKGI
jgi:hypothetical protein